MENDPFNGIQNPTIIVLAKWTASSTWGNTLVSYHGESGVGWQIRQIDGNFGKAGFTIRGTEGDDDSYPSDTDQTSFFIGSYYRKNSDTRIIRHNGTQTYSIADEGVIPYTGSGRSAIGGRFQADSNSSPGGMVKGAIREIIVFDGANDNEVIEMESYLARKWGLGQQLAANHPYHKTLLRTATTFDFENNASNYSIRVRASMPIHPSKTYLPSLSRMCLRMRTRMDSAINKKMRQIPTPWMLNRDRTVPTGW